MQAVDAMVDQLTHRLKTLPEHAALEALSERLSEVSTLHGQTQTELGDLNREQRKADADVEQVKTRRQRNLERIEAGLVSDPKQLQAMQHEIETLDRRISDLEDEELEVMERVEDAQSRLDALTVDRTSIQADVAAQTEARDAASGEIAEKLAENRAERELLAAEITPDLLALYEKLRAQLGGAGVGALQHRRCGGCHLDVGASEMAVIADAPSDEVLRCEECNRILVRTADSGL